MFPWEVVCSSSHGPLEVSRLSSRPRAASLRTDLPSSSLLVRLWIYIHLRLLRLDMAPRLGKGADARVC